MPRAQEFQWLTRKGFLAGEYSAPFQEKSPIGAVPQALMPLKSATTKPGDSECNNVTLRMENRWMEFSIGTAPSLSQGWWNQDPAPHAPLRERYSLTFQLILGLGRTHYTPASITAKNLGSLWRSLPQLNDQSGLNQMAEECDKLVEHLRAN
jgi:hypothetical protein